MSDPGNYNPTPEKTSDQNTFDAAEWYERGIVLRKAGLFDQAIEQFRKAATDQVYALKAYAQIGLCHRSSRRYEEAAKAFHNALNSPAASKKETVQILYVLARTLESLGRVGEALEFYRWLRREDGQFRDVTERIASLSATRARPPQASNTGGTIWTQPASQVFQNLLRSTK